MNEAAEPLCNKLDSGPAYTWYSRVAGLYPGRDYSGISAPKKGMKHVGVMLQETNQ